MFGKTVMGVDGSLFESALSDLKQARGAETDLDLGVDDLERTGVDLPRTSSTGKLVGISPSHPGSN